MQEVAIPTASVEGRELTLQTPRLGFRYPVSLFLFAAPPTHPLSLQIRWAWSPPWRSAWLVGEIPSVPALTPIGSFGVCKGEMTETGQRGAGRGERGGVMTSRPRAAWAGPYFEPSWRERRLGPLWRRRRRASVRAGLQWSPPREARRVEEAQRPGNA